MISKIIFTTLMASSLALAAQDSCLLCENNITTTTIESNIKIGAGVVKIRENDYKKSNPFFYGEMKLYGDGSKYYYQDPRLVLALNYGKDILKADLTYTNYLVGAKLGYIDTHFERKKRPTINPYNYEPVTERDKTKIKGGYFGPIVKYDLIDWSVSAAWMPITSKSGDMKSITEFGLTIPVFESISLDSEYIIIKKRENGDKSKLLKIGLSYNF